VTIFGKIYYHTVFIDLYLLNIQLIHAMMLKKRWRNFRILAIVVTKNGTLGKYGVSNYEARPTA
jgi:diketogulonate reductase-like aldo/keto reductase